MSYFIASSCFSGSLSYTPSTFVHFTIKSQLSSNALNTAAESVVKYGFHVQATHITTLCLFKCFKALLLIKVSETLGISKADIILTSFQFFSIASHNAIQFITVANIHI
jgi:hypothetical protein